MRHTTDSHAEIQSQSRQSKQLNTFVLVNTDKENRLKSQSKQRVESVFANETLDLLPGIRGSAVLEIYESKIRSVQNEDGEGLRTVCPQRKNEYYLCKQSGRGLVVFEDLKIKVGNKLRQV